MQQTVRSGEKLRSALCNALDSRAPSRWDNAMLNTLLDLVDMKKEARAPLALKQTLASLDSELSSVKLKQRRAAEAALEDQLAAAKAFDVPIRFGEWPPPSPPPPPARQKSRDNPNESAWPLFAGDGDGFHWTQSEGEKIRRACIRCEGPPI